MAHTRWKFVKDNDGRNYLIPATQEAVFRKWVEAEGVLEEGIDFRLSQIDNPSQYSFQNVERDR